MYASKENIAGYLFKSIISNTWKFIYVLIEILWTNISHH